jgi:fumarylacetoacetase
MTKSWIEIPTDSDFSLANLPWGVFSPPNASPRCATILGDTVIDLSVLEEAGLFRDIDQLKANTFNQHTQNAFIEHPDHVWISVRQRLIDLFRDDNMGDSFVRYRPNLRQAALYSVTDPSIKLHLPIDVQDYTDFYSSREHATNGKTQAEPVHSLHLPLYHVLPSVLHPIFNPFLTELTT